MLEKFWEELLLETEEFSVVELGSCEEEGAK